MERTKWIDRKFNFDFPVGLLKNMLVRLDGTSARLHKMTLSLSDQKTEAKPEGKWSIREHIGHLVDLEDLHIARLKEMADRKSELTAADMSNKKTEDSNHNNESTEDLIVAFSTKRSNLIKLLESMDEETQLFSSLHPRLNVQMRPIDVAYFTAEHDDHHLASIRELASLL
jgi:uncharacterized damage-inducible protein DinB